MRETIPEIVQDKWNNIIKNACFKATEDVMGKKTHKKDNENEEIKTLSNKQMKLKDDINSTIDLKNKQRCREKRYNGRYS